MPRQFTSEDFVIAKQQARLARHMFPGYPLDDLEQDAAVAILEHAPADAEPALVAHVCKMRLIDLARKRCRETRLYSMDAHAAH